MVVVLVRSLVGKLPTGRLDIKFICQRIIRKSLFLRKSVTDIQTDRRTLANFNIDKTHSTYENKANVKRILQTMEMFKNWSG